MLENDMSDSASAATTFIPFNNLTDSAKEFIKIKAGDLRGLPKGKLESDVEAAIKAYNPSAFAWNAYTALLAHLVAAKVSEVSYTASISPEETAWIDTAAEEVIEAKSASADDEGEDDDEIKIDNDPPKRVDSGLGDSEQKAPSKSSGKQADGEGVVTQPT